jgi:hypothetical protein
MHDHLAFRENPPFTYKGTREEGNTGFYFVRSTNATMKLFKSAFDYMIA